MCEGGRETEEQDRGTKMEINEGGAREGDMKR